MCTVQAQLCGWVNLAGLKWEISGLKRILGENAVAAAKRLVREIPRLAPDDAYALAADKIAKIFASVRILRNKKQ